MAWFVASYESFADVLASTDIPALSRTKHCAPSLCWTLVETVSYTSCHQETTHRVSYSELRFRVNSESRS